MKTTWWSFILLVIVLGTGLSVAEAQTVKITPIGQRTGDFCAGDRALLFEDPTGVRILYDPGNTVAGGTDPRLNAVHVILITHGHPDHLGGNRLSQDPNSSTASCAGALTTPAPNTNLADIAAAKNSAVIGGMALGPFLGSRIAAITGSPTAGCPAAGLTNEFTVPRAAPCTGNLGIGAKRTVRHISATEGVQVSVVNAEHVHDFSAALLTDPLRTNLTSNGLGGADAGLANGFVVLFTNGLRVYLSGDTGLFSEMRTVVHDFYGVNLAVINMGDIFTTGPQEAAFAINSMIRPVSVIPSHVNEAATSNGNVNPGSRTELFLESMSVGLKPETSQDRFLPPRQVGVYLPLSGLTMEFDGSGGCVSNCRDW